jgi:hypothetical protein
MSEILRDARRFVGIMALQVLQKIHLKESLLHLRFSLTSNILQRHLHAFRRAQSFGTPNLSK